MFSTYTTFIACGLGFIGNLLNILIFTNLRMFRGNRCAFYLIAESFVNIGQLCQLVFFETWALKINGIDPMNVSIIGCKIRTILPQWFRLMLVSIVCFVAIDQYLSTNPSPYLRQWSSLKIAHRQIYTVSILFLLHIIPFALYLQIYPSLGCIITNSGLVNYYSFFYFPILSGLLPIFLSSLSSLLAYRNVRRIVRRQIQIDRRRLDQQLTAMVFVRVIFFISLQLPFTIYQIYLLRRVVVNVYTLAYSILEWIQTISVALLRFNYAVNFYIFYATSTRYRRQVRYFLMKKCWQPLRQKYYAHQNTVRPSFARTMISVDTLE